MCITGITYGKTHDIRYEITSNTVRFRIIDMMSHYGYYTNFQGEFFG